MNRTPNVTCFYFNVRWDKTEEVFIANILTCVLNSMFSPLTFAVNVIVLHAIRKAQHLHSPSYVLLCCLVVPDLLVGAICQPSFVALIIAELEENSRAHCILLTLVDIFGYIASGVSLLTLAAVSIDRLLALTLHLRYHTIATLPRVFQAAFTLWIFTIVCVVPKFWLSYVNWIFLPLAIFLITFIVITSSTVKIFQIVRRHLRQINDQNMAARNLQTTTVNVLKCRKSAVTVFYVYGLFLISYLPFSVTVLVITLFGYTRIMKITYFYASTIVFINSFLNPLVYCWRIREIRQVVKNLLRRQ